MGISNHQNQGFEISSDKVFKILSCIIENIFIACFWPKKTKK